MPLFDAALAGLATIAVLALLTWVASLIRHDVSLVDRMWPLFIFAAAASYAFSLAAGSARAGWMLALAGVWAARLCAYITRRNWGHGEDRRYQAIRARNEPGFAVKSLLLVFGLQALLAWVEGITPLNVYFCHTPANELGAILSEVNNTFGERHSYLIEVQGAGRSGGTIEQRCAKQLHVSPFMALDMDYRFRVAAPDVHSPRLRVAVVAHGADGPVLHACFDAARQPLCDTALAWTLISHPLLTLKVMGAIHWEALRLFAKGLRLLPRPAPPARPTTVIRTEDP